MRSASSTIVSGAFMQRLAAEVQRAERQARHVGARVAVELEHVGAALDGGLLAAARADADDRLGACGADRRDELGVGRALPGRRLVRAAGVQVQDRGARVDAGDRVGDDLLGGHRDVRDLRAAAHHPGQRRVDHERLVRAQRVRDVGSGHAGGILAELRPWPTLSAPSTSPGRAPSRRRWRSSRATPATASPG